MSVTSAIKSKLTRMNSKPGEMTASFSGDKAAFFESLKKHDSNAIRYLGERVGAFLASLSASAALTNEDREELISDAVFVTVKKIGDGQFVMQDASPATYAIAVAKNLLGNHLQKKRLATTPLDALTERPDSGFDPGQYLQRKEREELLGRMLDRLEDNCRTLILLRYYEEMSDDEAISQKSTPYSNTDSLKSQRSKCLKKLSDMVRSQREAFR